MEKTLLMRNYLNRFSKSEKIVMIMKMPFDMPNLKKQNKKKTKKKEKERKNASRYAVKLIKSSYLTLFQR